MRTVLIVDFYCVPSTEVCTGTSTIFRKKSALVHHMYCT